MAFTHLTAPALGLLLLAACHPAGKTGELTNLDASKKTSESFQQFKYLSSGAGSERRRSGDPASESLANELRDPPTVESLCGNAPALEADAHIEGTFRVRREAVRKIRGFEQLSELELEDRLEDEGLDHLSVPREYHLLICRREGATAPAGAVRDGERYYALDGASKLSGNGEGRYEADLLLRRRMKYEEIPPEVRALPSAPKLLKPDNDYVQEVRFRMPMERSLQSAKTEGRAELRLRGTTELDRVMPEGMIEAEVFASYTLRDGKQGDPPPEPAPAAGDPPGEPPAPTADPPPPAAPGPAPADATAGRSRRGTRGPVAPVPGKALRTWAVAKVDPAKKEFDPEPVVSWQSLEERCARGSLVRFPVAAAVRFTDEELQRRAIESGRIDPKNGHYFVYVGLCLDPASPEAVFGGICLVGPNPHPERCYSPAKAKEERWIPFLNLKARELPPKGSIAAYDLDLLTQRKQDNLPSPETGRSLRIDQQIRIRGTLETALPADALGRYRAEFRGKIFPEYVWSGEGEIPVLLNPRQGTHDPVLVRRLAPALPPDGLGWFEPALRPRQAL